MLHSPAAFSESEHASRKPAEPSVARLLHPQTSAPATRTSNQASLRRLQTKLTISRPGDAFEQEADRVADRVMRMGDAPVSNHAAPQVQRMCADCEKEQTTVQPKHAPGQTASVTPALHSQINALNGGGQPLPASARGFFEPRFGYDFSSVRVHHDDRAAASATGLGARAYTLGNDVVFARGEYQPDSGAGRLLLAHELAHVMQQNQAGLAVADQPVIQRQTPPATPAPAPAVPAPTTQYCTPAQATMIQSHLADARTWLDDAEPKVAGFSAGTASAPVSAVVSKALTDNFHTTAPADVATIAGNFAAMRTALNGAMNYECASSFWCDGTDLAYVRGRFAWVRRLFDVNICPLWFTCANYFKRVSTLIHERAHQYPGATDNAYEWDPAYATLSAANAIDNADSYAVATRQIYHAGAQGPGLVC
jgi:hypothetical protein